MAKMITVLCRMCGKEVPGVATDQGIVAEVHVKDDEGIRCPGSNCPPAKNENKGENED